MERGMEKERNIMIMANYDIKENISMTMKMGMGNYIIIMAIYFLKGTY